MDQQQQQSQGSSSIDVDYLKTKPGIIRAAATVSAIFRVFKKLVVAAIIVHRKVPVLYFVSRVIATLSLIQLLRLLILCIVKGHRNEDSIAFQVSGLILYILAYSMIPYYDIAIYMSDIIPNVEKTVKTFEDIWNKMGSMDENARALQKQMSFKMWRIFIHNCIFDGLTLLLALNSLGDFDPIMLYSELPWKNMGVDLAYGMATMLLMWVTQMTWSWLLAVPGCLPFQYECLLKGLSACLKSNGNYRFHTTNIIEYYGNLEYSTRLLFKNGFAKALLSVYFLASLQQTITSFFIFNLIRFGGGWEEIQFLFFDLLCSTSRVFHGYYALSRVNKANKNLLNDFDIYLSKQQVTSWPAKNIQRKIKVLRKVQINVGPYSCNSNFPFEGGQVYLDNLVTAALWR